MVCAADRLLLRFVAEIRPTRPNYGPHTLAMFEDLRLAARAEQIELVGFAYAGSIEHGTGLRRYRDRECSIPGQAVDLVVELAPEHEVDFAMFERLHALADTCFEAAGQADDRNFHRDRLRWRLLPILARREADGYVQRLVRPERSVRTQVRVHTLEVRARTRASVEGRARLAFNDAVRLLKWWARARRGAELSSFALERLAALAFDRQGLGESPTASLAVWTEELGRCDLAALVDPAGDHEPLVCSPGVREALARWFADGAQALHEAARATDEAAVAELLGERLWGPAFVRACRS